MEVVYQRGNKVIISYLYNISRSGAFIQTPNLFDPGTQIDISFKIPGLGDSFNIMVTVTWNQGPERSFRPGMGVRFDKMSSEDRRRLDDFLKMFESA
jgi:uncharacterized protein (TIGR02266 family)